MSDTQKKSLHPLIAVAAGSVIVFSLVGVAAMTGLLPSSNGETKTDVGQKVNAPASSNTIAMLDDQANQTEKQNNKSSETPVEKSSTAVKNSNAAKSEQKSSEQKTAQKSTQQNSSNTVAERLEKPICHQCGVIESVRSVEQKAEKGSGVGAVAGAVIGGVIGNQIGGGNGRKLATVAGAVGGGYAGNEIEKSRNTRTTYEVRVKMENGDIRTFTPENKPEWRSGDRVKLVDGRLISND